MGLRGHLLKQLKTRYIAEIYVL